jgi:hypothetical protein
MREGWAPVSKSADRARRRALRLLAREHYAEYAGIYEQVRAGASAGNDARRTISVARRGTRFSRLKVEYPECVLNGTPRLQYDVDLARELLSRTAELSSSKRGLLAVLTEYRHALAALAAEPSARGSATLDNHITAA